MTKMGEIIKNELKFSELLLTRFTHDIAGSVSAVSNGIDFLMENKDSDDAGSIEIKNQAVDIIEESAHQSLARLQAYRTAYGIVYKADSVTMISELADIFKRYFNKSQIELRWNSSVPPEIPANVRQVLSCMILVMSKIMIYGAKASVSFSGENKNIITVKAHQHKIKDPTLMKAILNSDSDVLLDVENIIYFFTKRIAKAANANLELNVDEESEEKQMELKLTLP